MTAEVYWLPLRQALKQQENPERARQMKCYMRNQFDFYGIDAKSVKQLTARFIAQHQGAIPSLIDRIDWCWQQPQREWQYIGQQQLYRWRKELRLDDQAWLTSLTLQKAWWDTVDFLASNCWGHYFRQFPDQREALLPHWIDGEEMWLQRVAILFQLKYQEQTDMEWLLRAIEPLKGASAFFIQKAIGWALRQYAKTNPDEVRRYVEGAGLSPLSEREATKHLT